MNFSLFDTIYTLTEPWDSDWSLVGETGLAFGTLNSVGLYLGSFDTSSSEVLGCFSILVGSEEEGVGT